MAVDVLRACYRRPCKFYEGQTIKTDIVWYFVDDNTPWLDLQTVFWPYRSQSLIRNPGGVGEDTAKWPKLFNGLRPLGFPDGSHYEGTEAEFRGRGVLPAGFNAGVPAHVGCFVLPGLGILGGLVASPPRPGTLGITGGIVPCSFPRMAVLGLTGGVIPPTVSVSTLAIVGGLVPLTVHSAILGLAGRRCYGPICTPYASRGGVILGGSSVTSLSSVPPAILREDGGYVLREDGGRILREG